MFYRMSHVTGILQQQPIFLKVKRKMCLYRVLPGVGVSDFVVGFVGNKLRARCHADQQQAGLDHLQAQWILPLLLVRVLLRFLVLLLPNLIALRTQLLAVT